MSKEIEEKIAKIPLLNKLALVLKEVKLPAFEGLSLYDLMEMYIFGIFKGAISTRASSISFSLFLALFPLLIFLITLVPFIIPYVSIGNENFDSQFLVFLGVSSKENRRPTWRRAICFDAEQGPH